MLLAFGFLEKGEFLLSDVFLPPLWYQILLTEVPKILPTKKNPYSVFARKPQTNLNYNLNHQPQDKIRRRITILSAVERNKVSVQNKKNSLQVLTL